MGLQAPDNSIDGPRDCGMFFLDVVGAYAPQHLKVRTCKHPRPTNEQLDHLIDQAWEMAVWEAKKKNRSLFNGSLCRLVDYTADDDHLELQLGRVSYKEFVGTNQTQAYVRYVHGPEVLADPLGVSAAVLSADDFILLGRRSEKVVQYQRRIHPVGGMVEIDGSSDEVPNPIDTMRAELREETGVNEDDVESVEILGLVRDKHTVQPEMIFDIYLRCDASEIKKGFASAQDAHEHLEMIPVRNHPASVVTFLQKNFNDLTPVSMATLLLHGMHSWGSGWFAGARGYLRSVI